MRKTQHVIAAALCLLGAMPLTGQVIGLPANSGNCIPFGCNDEGWNTRYQQVYDAAAFGSAFSISSISFFEFTGGLSSVADGLLNAGTFDIYLSTTSKAVGSLSSTLADNLGSDAAFFAQWVSAGGLAPSVLSFSGTPFFYNPLFGNLLLDIRMTGISRVELDPDLDVPAFYDASYSSSYSRLGEGSSEGQFGYGLVTGFNQNVVPEPASMVLLATGLASLAGIGLMRRRRHG